MARTKKTLECIVVGVCLGALILGAAMLTRSASSGATESPMLFKTEHDCGPVFPKQKITHTFQMVNPFDEALQVERLKRSCGCATAELGTAEIPPRETTTLNMVVDVPDDAGEAKFSTLVIAQGKRTGRGAHFDFLMQAQSATVIEIQDGMPFIQMGQLECERIPVTQAFRVRRGSHPMQWDTLQCHCSSDCIDVHLRRLDLKEWLLELTLKDVGSLGHIRESLEFCFFDGQESLPYRLTRRVEAELLGPIQAKPHSLLFGAMPIGEEIKKTIRLTNTFDEDNVSISIISVEPSDPDCIKVEPQKLNTGEEVILVTFVAGNKGRYGGSIAIEARADRDYELNVPYGACVVD